MPEDEPVMRATGWVDVDVDIVVDVNVNIGVDMRCLLGLS